MAMGSASEGEYQLLLARDLGYLKDDDYNVRLPDVIEIKRMLAALMSKLKS
jgi:four helix bundle protein